MAVDCTLRVAVVALAVVGSGAGAYAISLTNESQCAISVGEIVTYDDDRVPLVLTVDEEGNPETVTMIPRRRMRRLDVFDSGPRRWFDRYPFLESMSLPDCAVEETASAQDTVPSVDAVDPLKIATLPSKFMTHMILESKNTNISSSKIASCGHSMVVWR